MLGHLLEQQRQKKIKTIISSDINLSSLWYQLGGNCLSTDEMFKAMQYKEDFKKCEIDKDKWS